MRTFALALAVGLLSQAVLAACGDDSGDRSTYTQPSDVYAALVGRLEGQDKVLHATETSLQEGSSDESTFEYWIDEARDLAREDQDLFNVFPKPRWLLVVDGLTYSYVGSSEPNHWEAPSCEGVSAPATSLLLSCQGVEGAHSELVDDSGDALRIVTTGSYGPDIDDKTWSITLTLDTESLLPIAKESDTWGLLNGQPYEVRETSTYTTEFVERDQLPEGLFDLDDNSETAPPIDVSAPIVGPA